MGIGTIAPIGTGIDCLNREALFQSVGVGTTSRRCVVDFADAGLTNDAKKDLCFLLD